MGMKTKDLQNGIRGLFSEDGGNTTVTEQRRPSGTPMSGRRRKEDTRALMTAEDERTTLVLNKHQYRVIRAIAHNEGVTIKAIVSEMFRIGIELYEKKNGPVELQQEKDIKEIF